MGTVALGVALSAWYSPAVISAEPAREFLKQLREVAYFDTAIAYLDRLDQFPGVDAELLQAVQLEKAQIYVDAGVAARDANRRDKFFSKAEASLQAFLDAGSHPDIPGRCLDYRHCQ